MEKILVSACPAGVPCRYDGRSKDSPQALGPVAAGRAVVVCPEGATGSTTARSPGSCGRATG
ncbi:DUF523 domain-containing protein [Kitasatospora purpeofusca]|uniref:2-thiouracil desulfurase family protein n=1 Tax=Kitasatospora purpeofusca TaxID=67352 RepID=UPI0032447550